MWRKSSYSQGASNCVETAAFRTSSYCAGSSSTHECIEAGTSPGVVKVRDTMQAGDPNRVVLGFSPAAWRGFTAGLR